MKFSIKDLFSKCDQICRKMQIWSHLLKKSIMENFIFVCSVRNMITYDAELLYDVLNYKSLPQIFNIFKANRYKTELNFYLWKQQFASVKQLSIIYLVDCFINLQVVQQMIAEEVAKKSMEKLKLSNIKKLLAKKKERAMQQSKQKQASH